MPYRSIFRPGLFEGLNVIVTGGGSGIGRCIAHELSALGAHPVLIGRRIDPLREVAGEIEAEGGLLGLFPGQEFPSQTLRLRPGQKIILFSDGMELTFFEDRDRETD